MKKKDIFCGLLLLAVLLISFGVRALPASLPAVPEEIRSNWQDEDGIPYLTEMDSYFYLRFTREMSEAGSPFFYNKRGEDPMMGQRPVKEGGQGIPILLSVLAYWLWRFLSFFGSVPVIQVARWMGPVFGSLAVIPAFFYVKRRTNLAGGVTAGLLTGLALPFVSHTHIGFFDTDMLLGILPAGFVLLQLWAMQARKPGFQAIAGVCAGLLLGLLSLTWFAFYMYFWLLVLGGLLGVILVMACTGRCPFRRRLAAARGWLFSVLSALLFVFLFRGQPALNSLMNVMSTFRSVGGSVNVFPFVHQYTGEMQSIPLFPDQGIRALFRADLSTGIGALGGLIPCLCLLAALPLSLCPALLRRKTPRPEDRTEALIAALTEAGILFLWLGFGIVLMRSRRRFTEIAALPAAILAGLAVGFAVRMLRDRKAWIRVPVCAVLIAGCVLPVGLGAAGQARAALPSVTDSMNDAMISIRDTQPENAAIASWWDYGYFMQYKARRRAITDGGTSSGAVNFFLGKALLSTDPAQMTGIFRMLETSAVSAVDDLVRRGAGQAEATEYLLRIASLSREEAQQLTPPASMTEEQLSALLDKTHPPEKIPLLLVLSEDMLKKTDAISYYGFWDVHTRTQSEESYCLRSPDLKMLSPGTEAVFSLPQASLALRVLKDPIGLMQVSAEKDGQRFRPGRIICWRDGLKAQDLRLSETGPAVMLIENEGWASAMVISQNLCDSMLIRLFCGRDKSIPGIALLNEWKNPSVQVWQMAE